jgi:hypothetical protein
MKGSSKPEACPNDRLTGRSLVCKGKGLVNPARVTSVFNLAAKKRYIDDTRGALNAAFTAKIDRR